jgi:hypothetical protein
MPFLARHSRNAAKRPAPLPVAPVAPVALVAAAFALVDVVLEVPPQAARPRLASSRTTTPVAVPLETRLVRLM